MKLSAEINDNRLKTGKEFMTDTSSRKLLYSKFAVLLEYPQSSLCEDVVNCIEYIKPEFAEAALYLDEFAEYAGTVDLITLQEQYTVTFDLDPVCTLDIGYHIFGETHKRGSFLAGMQKMMQDNGINTGGELPDHFPAVLKLLDRIPRDEECESLVKLILAPTLVQMKKEFKTNNKSYSSIIYSLDCVLRSDFRLSDNDIPEISIPECDFTRCNDHAEFSGKGKLIRNPKIKL